MAKRGKTVALICTIAGLAVLIALVWTLRYRIQERWWIYQLGSGDPEVQIMAARKLGERECRAAIPHLIERYRETDLREAKRAMFLALYQMGLDGLAPLLDAQKSREDEENVIGRITTSEGENLLLLRCLPLVGPSARGAIFSSIDGDALEGEALRLVEEAVKRETDARTLFAGAKILAEYQPGLREVRQGISEGLKDMELRCDAIHLLARVAPFVSYAAPALAELLDDPDPDVRDRAAGTLAHLGEAARGHFRSILARIDDPIEKLRLRNRLALERLCEGEEGLAEELQKALLADLQDPDYMEESPGERGFALGSFGAAAGKLVPDLLAILGKEGHERYDAMLALSQIAPGDPGVASAISSFASEYEEFLVLSPATVIALGKVGKATGKIPEPLLRALASGDRVLADVARALGEMGPAAGAAAEGLRNLARSDDPTVRLNAAAALYQVTGEGKDRVIESLRPPTEDESWPVPEDYLRVLSILGNDGRSAREVVERAMDRIAPEFIEHLSKLGWAADLIVPRLLDACIEPDRESTIAGNGIVCMGAPAVPPLLEALANRPPMVRPLIARILGRIGPGARDAVPALRKCLGGEDEELDLQARRALERIEGPPAADESLNRKGD
jgi:HEAT repeat protein